MKILYLTHQYFPHYIGGTEVYLQGLSQIARQNGHQVHIITCREVECESEFYFEQYLYEETPITEIHFNLSSTFHPIQNEQRNPYAAQIVKMILEEFQPDIVHVLHAMKLSGAAIEVCHMAKIPVIVTLCDFWFICPRHTLLKWNEKICYGPKTPLSCRRCINHLHGHASFSHLLAFSELKAMWQRRHYLRSQLLKATRIIALSSFQKEIFVANGYPKDRIEVITHGLNTSILGPPSSKIRDQEGKIKVGFIGNLVAFKGAHILVQAILSSPSLSMDCLIFGPLNENDSYISALRSAAQLDTRISFKGGFQPHQMRKVMEEIDILAIPALWHENEPLVVKAALYLGIPTLASRIGSLSQMIIDGVNGWLVEPGDVEAWSHALRKAIQKPILSFAPHKIKSIEENGQEILTIYEQEQKAAVEEKALKISLF